LRGAPRGATNVAVSTESWNGHALFVRRASMRWTLGELKRRLAGRHRINVSEATISRWENGRTPTDSQKIARALGKLFGCSSLAFYRDPIVSYRSDAPDDRTDEEDSSPW